MITTLLKDKHVLWALFITGGGAIALLGGTNGFVQSTSPASGQSGLYISGGNIVTVKNNTAGTVYYRIMGFRTRTSQ